MNREQGRGSWFQANRDELARRGYNVGPREPSIFFISQIIIIVHHSARLSLSPGPDVQFCNR